MAPMTPIEPQPAQLKRSLSVIVTAMNEQGNLRPTVEAVVESVSARFEPYEIIVIDDGSTDRTPMVAADLMTENTRIRVHRNPVNRGLAYSYRRGLELATLEYTSWVAGNNLVPPAAFNDIYDRVGEADMVVSYIKTDVRRRSRQILSRTFTTVVNTLFGTRLRYFTGPCVYRTEVAKRIRHISHGSMFVVETVLRLVKSGQRYVEVGLDPLPRSSGASKTFRPRNVAGIAVSLLHLFWEIRVMRRSLGLPKGEELVDGENVSAFGS